MKKILLHVGTLKTGSTTIQQTLFRNRRVLERHGIHYLSIAACHVDFATAFMAEPWKFFHNRRLGLSKAQVIEKKEQVLDLVEKELKASRCDWVIISAEQFSDLGRERIHEVVRWLSTVGEVHVVYFVREAEAYLSSISQEVAKIGVTHAPAQFGRGLYRLVESPTIWRKAIGSERFSFYRFEDAVRNGLTDTLLESVGLPCIENMGIEEGHFNQSISGLAVECMFQFNRVAPAGSHNRNARLERWLTALPGGKYHAPDLTETQVDKYNKIMTELHESLGVEPYPLLAYSNERGPEQTVSSEALYGLIAALNDSFNEADGKGLRRIPAFFRRIVEQFKDFLRCHPTLKRFARRIRGW